MSGHVAIWDEIGADGSPRLAPDHVRLTPDEARAVAGYLESGALVAATTDRKPDALSDEPTALVVPQNFRTDGEWVWSEEVTYYVREHALAPHEPFLSFVRSREYKPRHVEESGLRAARELLFPAQLFPADGGSWMPSPDQEGSPT